MMDLGPHAVYIWASYVAVAAALAGLITWLVTDAKRLNRAIADLDARGVRRRSDPRQS